MNLEPYLQYKWHTYIQHDQSYTKTEVFIFKGNLSRDTKHCADGATQRLFNGLQRTSFLSEVWFGSIPSPPLPPRSVSSMGDTQEGWERETGEGEREGSSGYGTRWKELIRRRESLVLYISFNTACWLGHRKSRDPCHILHNSLLLRVVCRCYVDPPFARCPFYYF